MDIRFDTLLNHLTNQASPPKVVLVANHRQSRFLIEQIERFDQSTCLVFDSFEVYSVQNWIEEIWAEQVDLAVQGFNRKLLTQMESLLFWKAAVKALKDAPALVNQNKLAEQFQKADEIALLYELPVDELKSSTLVETLAFLEARAHYESILSATNTIDLARSQQVLAEHYGEKKSKLNLELYLYGFAELPSLTAKLINSTSLHPIIKVAPSEINISLDFIACDDATSEIAQAANWAKSTSEQHPNDSIAVVVPDLIAKREEYERVFLHFLEPYEYLTNQNTIIPKLFDISTGLPLAGNPLVNCALTLLSLVEHQISKNDILLLAQSNYWSGAYDACKHALNVFASQRFENQLNISSALEFAQHRIQTLNGTNDSAPKHANEAQAKLEQGTQNSQSSDAQRTFKSLLAIRETRLTFRHKHSHKEWVKLLLKLLESAHWPGVIALESYDYQVAQSFMHCLQSLEKLDVLHAKAISLAEFREALQLALDTTIHHPEVKNPKIRVMGLMEASGLSFDHCLIVGLNENNLPPAPKPHPFLPKDLQVKYNAPKSTPERELFYARQLLENLVKASTNVSLSYAKNSDSGQLKPSPLFTEIRIKAEANANSPTPSISPIESHCKAQLHFSNFDFIPTGLAPAVIKASVLRGGAYHFDLHWTNPLYAFFQYRLNIQEPECDQLGLSGRERGNLVHQCLANIYSAYNTCQDIQNLVAQKDFEDFLNKEANTGLNTLKIRNTRLPKLLEAYERKRLIESLKLMLELDAQRQDNFSTKGIELQSEIQLSYFTLNLRLDRVDTVNEQHIVIDYKTNTNSLGPLVKRPITSFQLPLYSKAQLGKNIISVAYAEIHEGRVKYTGLGDASVKIPGIVQPNKPRQSEYPEDWHTTLELWSDDIEMRASEIAKGEVDYQVRNTTQMTYFSHFEPAVREEERLAASYTGGKA